MGNLVTKYQKSWHKDTPKEERIRSQERIFDTFVCLFTKILKVPFQGTILDIGCGDGALVKVLGSKAGIDAKGIDICDGINFERDLLPFQDDEFDIAVMYSVIEHIYEPGYVLSEIKRILKRDGYLIVITSNFTLSNPLVCDLGFYEDPTHVHPYNPKSIEKLMKLYDFKKTFIGLWTVKKSYLLWKLPLNLQFTIGAILPFSGQSHYVPSFLKGKSKSMLCVFQNDNKN